MKCQTCGSENTKDAQFCLDCGTSLSSSAVTVGPELPMVNFGEAISRGFCNYFKFSGRATRAEYWFWILFSTVVQLIPAIGLFICLAILIPSLAVTSRRLHDIGKTGWWQLVIWIALLASLLFLVIGLVVLGEGEGDGSLFFPLSGVAFVVAIAFIVIVIVWSVKKGDEGPNKYGPDPRQAISQ